MVGFCECLNICFKLKKKIGGNWTWKKAYEGSGLKNESNSLFLSLICDFSCWKGCHVKYFNWSGFENISTIIADECIAKQSHWPMSNYCFQLFTLRCSESVQFIWKGANFFFCRCFSTSWNQRFDQEVTFKTWPWLP